MINDVKSNKQNHIIYVLFTGFYLPLSLIFMIYNMLPFPGLISLILMIYMYPFRFQYCNFDAHFSFNGTPVKLTLEKQYSECFNFMQSNQNEYAADLKYGDNISVIS